MTHSSFRGSSGEWFRRAVVLICMMFALLGIPLSGSENQPRKVVRIPYQEFNRQMVVDEHNNPVSGYAYDYIQTIAAYAGWEVKYIPCESFYECVQMLLSGKADLFYEMSYTEERAKKLLFPDEPMGYEYYYLYASDKNGTITSGDYKSMNGKKVGVTTGTMLIETLEKWCKKKNVAFDIVKYDSIPDKEADLYAGKIDLDLEVSMLAKSNLSAVEKIGSSPYYLAANKQRPDLIADINAAMDKVLNNDLYYFSRLQERYFSETVLSRNLTLEEKNWVAEHKVLRVGYLADYLPFCGRDKNGEAIGAVIDAIDVIIMLLKLEDRLDVEFVCFESQKEGYLAVQSGKVDMMIPAYINNSVKHDYHLIGGKVLATLASDIAYSEDRGGGMNNKRIGVNRSNLMQYYYSRDVAPRSKIVFYDDIQGCLDGLVNGTSDGTFLNGIRSNALLKPGKYRSLRTVRAKTDFQLRMAFAENNVGLMLLMNRGLTMLDSDFINKASYSYVGRIYNYSMLDFLQDHILPVIVTVAILVALSVALVGYKLSNRRLAGFNRELIEYSETIECQRKRESDLRKQLEKKQDEIEVALQMAQRASRAKTIFLSNMSHDIRTPMNAIVGFTGLASKHVNEPERVRDYLETIARSSDHLLSLINDVLDMSRIESGKMSLSEKVESLADILHALRSIVRADVRARRHDFHIDATEVRNEHVYCDRMRLNQVLLNLLSNAIKYTPPGGKISLRVAQKPTDRPGFAAFEFRCKDNGIGMSDEIVKTIFEPFTREVNSTVSGIQGSGLGMAITKNIVDMMGGSISFTTKKGEGTEFVVSVALKIAGEKADPAIPELSGLRALVVGDDEKFCRHVAEMLEKIGMRGEWCVSGKDAVARAKEALAAGELFKVCVVDRRTRDVDGIETARGIRSALGKDAFVILTASDLDKLEGEAGITGFIPKPIFMSDLRKELLQACGKTGDQTGRQDAGLSFEGRKVLMVDDSKLNLKVGTLLLQEQGMIVDTASNGQAAVDIIREKGVDAYDFVLMDVQMPVMNGYEATSAIRKLPGGDKLKIIAFSANAFEEDREKSLQSGMDGHIAKPLKIEALLNELKRFAV